MNSVHSCNNNRDDIILFCGRASSTGTFEKIALGLCFVSHGFLGGVLGRSFVFSPTPFVLVLAYGSVL